MNVNASRNPMMRKSLQQGLKNAETEYQSSNMVFEKITLKGVANKVLGLFGLTLITALFSWLAPTNLSLILLFVGMLGGLGFGIAASMSKGAGKGLIVGYALFEGLMLGAFSHYFELRYPGIVVSAVLSTLITAGIMFVVYRSGLIKVTSRFRKVMIFALFGYLGFALINLIFAMFTGTAGVYSTPFAWLIALFGVVLASMTLTLDFDTIEQGVSQGWPKEMEWRAAFGLISTLIWLYVEMLRLLSYLRR